MDTSTSTVRELIEAQAAERPEAVYAASTESDTTVTFGELARTCRRVAALLQAQGSQPGDVVSLVMPNGLHTLQLLLTVGAGVTEGEYVNRAQVVHGLTGNAMSAIVPAGAPAPSTWISPCKRSPAAVPASPRCNSATTRTRKSRFPKWASPAIGTTPSCIPIARRSRG